MFFASKTLIEAGAAPVAFVRVEAFTDPAAVLAVWRSLAPATCASFYQTEKFLSNWLETIGREAKATPFFIVAYDGSGAPLALLPLGLFRFGPLRVAQFLGGKDSNYNLGLFRAGAAFSAADLRRLLHEAARQAKNGPHLYRLLSLPLVWRGAANPLCLLPHRPAASCAYATVLPEDGEAFLAARLSANTRKKLRKKEKRLAAMGALHYFRAENQRHATLILDAFFEQKCRRLSRPFDAPVARAFYESLAAFGADGAPALELHALALDERIVAVLAAGLNGGRLQGLFNSYDGEPEIAKSSPGDLLLTYVLRDACARKITAFDLGLGDARYKATFCDEVEQMADALFAPSLIGRAALPAFAAALAAKTSIKRHPRVNGAIERLRRLRKVFGY